MSNDEQGIIVFDNLIEAGKSESFGKVVQVAPAAEAFNTTNASGTIASMSLEQIQAAAVKCARRFTID